VAHNAPFDMLHLARLLEPDNVVEAVTTLMERTTDTSILAHLIGHGLKNLAEEYVDPDATGQDME